MIAAIGGAPRHRQHLAAELYEQGLAITEVAQRLGVARSTVHGDLTRAGVRLRHRHLRSVPDPGPLQVPLERAAIAYTAQLGWHLVEAPPGWFLDLLAELD